MHPRCQHEVQKTDSGLNVSSDCNHAICCKGIIKKGKQKGHFEHREITYKDLV